MRTALQNKVLKDKKFNAFLVLFSVAFFLIIQPVWMKYQYFVTPAPAVALSDFFEVVAFDTDYGETKSYITKWHDDLRIVFKEAPDAFNREDLEVAIRQISSLTGLKFSFTSSGNGNVFFYFMQHKDFVSRLEVYDPDLIKQHENPQDILCAAFSEYNVTNIKQYQIKNSDVFLSTDIPQLSFYRAFIEKLVSSSSYKWKHSCLREELMQILGLPADSDIVSPSVVNDYEQTEIYSANDMIIIRTLYDPRIQAGMHKDEVMPLVRNVIIPELIAAYEKGGEEALYQ